VEGELDLCNDKAFEYGCRSIARSKTEWPLIICQDISGKRPTGSSPCHGSPFWLPMDGRLYMHIRLPVGDARMCTS
jgi:hypothetical protein